jgi:tetratricopeptide (TPR) repeat protein
MYHPKLFALVCMCTLSSAGTTFWSSPSCLAQSLGSGPGQNTYDYWMQRGHSEHLAMEDEDALNSLNHALNFKPNDARAIVERGRVYLILGRTNEAAADFSRVIQLMGGLKNKVMPSAYDIDSAIQLGKIYSQQRRFDKAINLFDLAFKQSGDVNAQICKAETQSKAGDYKGALQSIDVALKIKPQSIAGLKCKAETQSHLKDFNGSEASYTAAIAILNRKRNRGPRELWALLDGRAKAYKAMGKNDLAQRDMAAQTGDRDSFIELTPFRSSTGRNQ